MSKKSNELKFLLLGILAGFSGYLSLNILLKVIRTNLLLPVLFLSIILLLLSSFLITLSIMEGEKQ